MSFPVLHERAKGQTEFSIEAWGIYFATQTARLADVYPREHNVTQFTYLWKTVLRISGGISTHHQEYTQLCLQYLVLVKP